MKALMKLLGHAPFVFVVATAGILWATGYLHLGAAGPGTEVASEDAAQDGHDHSAHAAEPVDPHAGHDHAAGEHEDEAEPEPVDPHAGHDHAAGEHGDEAEPEPVDPHAGHDHAAGEHGDEAEPEPVDPHAGHDHAAGEHGDEAEPEPVDPHAGHDHAAGEHGDEAEPEPEDPHAGHNHAAGEHGDEAEPEPEDPHAGHNHAAGEHGDEAEPEPMDPHAGHDHAAGELEGEAEVEWCDEHNVAESACTRCNPGLIASFKARGDWCAGHGLPESQCVACGAAVVVPSRGSTDAFAAIEKRRCEHNLRSIDCDNCRFEVGVVKVDPGVARALLRTARVEQRRGSDLLRLTGQVHFDRSLVVGVPSPAGGRVVELAVELGRWVERGDVLAVLHSGEIADARAAYLQAVTICEIAEKERERQAEMTQALEALLASLPAEIDRPMSGEGAEIDAEVPSGLVGEWKSKLVGAAARLRIARIKHDRELELEAQGISARAEHEEAHREYEAAKAGYAALIEEAKLSIHLEMLKADSAARQGCTGVTASKEKLRFLGLSDEDLERLVAGDDDGQFARLLLRAPRSGTVTSFEVAVGHFVDANEHLFTIADLEHLWVWCDLYERDLAAVSGRLGGGKSVPATISVSAFPGREFDGVLDLLGSEVDVHTRTVKARIQVPNPRKLLRPGMFADVEVLLITAGTVRVVPRSAVLSDDGTDFVFQYWRDDMWVRRDVQVLSTSDELAVIDGSVPVGATVASGAFMLKGDVLREKMGAG